MSRETSYLISLISALLFLAASCAGGYLGARYAPREPARGEREMLR